MAVTASDSEEVRYSTQHGGASDEPVVSVVVPARDEADLLRDCLESVRGVDTPYPVEVLVVDGGSTDGTRAIAREQGVTVLDQDGTGIAAARNQGARAARGEWLAFVDADTVVRPPYVTDLLGFVEANGLAAASSFCRVTGPLRAKAVELTINHCFPRLRRPILPGFNTFVHRPTFEAVGGYPCVPNEDTAFSRRLGRLARTGYCPSILVETDGRRVASRGLTGTLAYYLRLDWHRLRATY